MNTDRMDGLRHPLSALIAKHGPLRLEEIFDGHSTYCPVNDPLTVLYLQHGTGRELFALDPQAVAAVMSADTATDLPSVDAAVEVPIDAAVDAVAEPGADGVVDHDQRGRGERVHDQQGSR